MSLDSSQPYAASYVLLNKNGKNAFVLRGEGCGWMSGYYGLPSGKIDKNESATVAATREVEEEVDVKIKQEKLRHVLTMHRHEKNDKYPEWVDFYFEADEWEGDVRNSEPHMHDELAWFSSDELPENIIPSVRAALEAIQNDENFTEYGF
ncbi:MAG: NUDIX domain-containing protein [Candidatus Saccharibacteria bacterium]|nr:NUDIX domain-containing protein [Candidatus Saccharibacteria bacterium]